MSAPAERRLQGRTFFGSSRGEKSLCPRPSLAHLYPTTARERYQANARTSGKLARRGSVYAQSAGGGVLNRSDSTPLSDTAMQRA
jgi:hypothetical protein